MATSGTYAFVLTVNEVIAEAFERAGIDQGAVTANQKQSARRSLNLILTHWGNRRIGQWMIEQRTVTLTASDATPSVDARMLDIIDMVLRRDGRDVPMVEASRSEYLEIPDKATEGRPDRWFLDRQRDAPVLYLWPVPENSTDIIVYDQIRRLQDISAANAADADENPDVHALWYEALCAELARRMALKFSPARYGRLREDAAMSFREAKEEGRDKAATTFSISYRRR